MSSQEARRAHRIDRIGAKRFGDMFRIMKDTVGQAHVDEVAVEWHRIIFTPEGDVDRTMDIDESRQT